MTEELRLSDLPLTDLTTSNCQAVEITSKNMSTSTYTFITIIIAVRNKVSTISRAIESILSQTYQHKELIVIDGASTDGSLEKIQECDSNISYWISEPDKGVYQAWNKAIKNANGQWICFLGADDYFWDDNVLSNLATHLISAKEEHIRVVYGKNNRVDPDRDLIRCVGKPWLQIGWLMKHGMVLPHPGLMHHRSLFDLHGNFDESFKIAGDYDFLLRELKDNKAIFVNNIIVAGCTVGGLADSNNMLAHEEIAIARRNNGLKISIIWCFIYMRNYLRSIVKTFQRKDTLRKN